MQKKNTYCYKVPKADVNTFPQSIETLFMPACNKKSVFLIGYFKLNLLTNNLLLDTAYSLGMYSLINKPTRITSHSATTINNILLAT